MIRQHRSWVFNYRAALAIAGATLVGSAVGGVALYRVANPPRPTAEMGREIPPLPAEFVGYRRFNGRADCNWQHPGAQRFTGDPQSALAALGVPEEIRGRLWRRMVAHESTEYVTASAVGIIGESTRTLYAPGMAMTYGENIVCYNTFAKFEGEQRGRLYVEGGYHVWVPDICGNVSRLLPWNQARRFYRSDRPSVLPGRVDRGAQPFVVLPEAGDLDEGYGAGGGRGDRYGGGGPGGRGWGGETRQVDEPNTLGLLALVIVLVRVKRWWSKQR